MIIQSRQLFARFFSLLKSGVFWAVSCIGTSIIFLFSFIFYSLEKDINPKINHFIDSLWWGYATATTVGYGDITPVTFQGKVLGIFLMLTGTALFALYTALFARALLDANHSRKN